MSRFQGMREPLFLEELEERVAPAVFVVGPDEYLLYDVAAGQVGVLHNTGTVDLRVDVDDPGAGNAADTIVEVEIAGDGGALNASTDVGDVNDDYDNDGTPDGYDLGAVRTAQSITVQAGATIAGSTVDGGAPPLPITATVTTGGIDSVEIGGDLNGELVGSTGPVGPVDVGGSVVGTVNITGTSVADVTVAGNWIGAMNIAASGGGNVGNVSIGGHASVGTTGTISGANVGEVTVGGYWTGAMNITASAGVVGDVSIGGDVTVPTGNGTITGSGIGDVSVAGGWTGGMSISASGVTGIGFVEILGDVDGAAGTTRSISANTAGADLGGLYVGGDVLGGLNVSVADEVFGRPGALPGYTEALWFNGDYTALGTNTISVGGACPSFYVEGAVTADGTSTLSVTLDDVDPLDYNDGVFFGGDVAGSVNLTLRDLHGRVDLGGLVDVTFGGEVYTFQGDTMNLSIGDSYDHAADTLMFVGNVWQNDNGASINISGYANSVEAYGFFEPATYSVESESAYFHYDFGMPDRHVQAGDDPMFLLIQGDAYINYNGSRIHLVQGLDTGSDFVYGTIDDSIVYPWPGNGMVEGSFQSTSDVVIHALGDVLTGDDSGGITATRDVFVTSLFGQIGRTDQTFGAGDDISVISWFGPIAADLNASGTIHQIVAGTLPGGGPVDFGYWEGTGLWDVDWGMGFAYWTDGDDEVGTADDVSIFDNLAGPDGVLRTDDDDFSWVNNSAIGRILQLDWDGNGILGKYWDSNLGMWLQDDTFGWAGWWDHDSADERTDWSAGSIAGISGSEEVRAVIDSTGDIGVHYNGTSSDGTNYSQDDIYQGIVSLHTISGKINAGGDIVLVHATNLVGEVGDYDYDLPNWPVYTEINAGGDITEVSANGIPHPDQPAQTLDGDIAARISAGGRLHLVAAGGNIWSADEGMLIGGEVADTEISAGAGIDFIIAGGTILGSESRNLPAGRVFDYTDDLGIAQQLVVTRGTGTAFYAYGVITDVEMDGSNVRLYSTDLIGDVTNLGDIDRVIAGADPGPDGILGTADDILPGGATRRGPDGIYGTDDDLKGLQGGLPGGSIFSVTSYQGDINRVVGTGTVVTVCAAGHINEVSSIGGFIGMTAAVGYHGLGSVNGNVTGLISAATGGGFLGSVAANRDIDLVQAVSSTGFSSTEGAIVGDIVALDDIGLVRTNWFGERVQITANDNIDTVIQFTQGSGVILDGTFVTAGADLLDRGVTGDINRVLVGVTVAGERHPDDADIFLNIGAAINIWAARDIDTVRHTGFLYGMIDAGRDIDLVESLHGAAGILSNHIVAGRDIHTIRSGHFIGEDVDPMMVPYLSPIYIEAGRDISTIFARADISADVVAGDDVNRIETDSGFLAGTVTTGDDLRYVVVGGEDITAGDLLLADLFVGDDILRIESYTISGNITTGLTDGINGNINRIIAHGGTGGFGITGDVTVGGYVKRVDSVGGISGDFTAGRYIDQVRLGTIDVNGSVAVEADITGLFMAGTARPSDIKYLWMTGNVEGTVAASRDIVRMTALSGIYGTVAAGDDIRYLRTGDIGDGMGTLISAGFSPGPNDVYDIVGDDVPTPGRVGTIGSINIRPRGDVTGGDGDVFANTVIRATGNIGRTTLPSGGGGTITEAIYSAGFAPGADGALGTPDDVFLRAANIGNIGTSSRRFENVDGIFQATGNINDINSDGILGNADTVVWAMNRIDDLRARGEMAGTFAAGNDIDSIIAGNLDGALISAGFTPGADGVFDFNHLAAADDAASGFRGDVRRIDVSGNVTDTLVRATGRIGDTQVDGDIVDSFFSAGFGAGADGQLGTGDDTVLFFQDIVRVNSDGATGITGTSFQATDDIWTVLSDGALGTAGTTLFAGDDIGTLRSVADMDFDTIRAGDFSGTGVIDFIRVNEPDDLGGPDPTLLSDVFATLRINRIDVEAAALGGTVWAPVLDLNLDTDNDGA